MRFVPSTRIGSLLVGSVRQAAKETGAYPELARSVLATTLEAVETHEANLSGTGGFKTLNDEMSEVFLKWATALVHGDGHAADKLEEDLDALAAKHRFSYVQTKRIFHSHYSKSSYYDALHDNYRAWNGADANFAVVTNKVSGSGKVAVIGDWGTGEADADAVMKAVMAHKPDVILHLGDIYEAGLSLEIEEHFLGPITRVCGDTPPPIFTIPGNHEYFSGGKGFFELIDVLNGGKPSDWNQEASFFCLRSDDGKYQFPGADSGLGCIDHPSCPNLEASEIAWHRARIAEFSGKTIFMTHHQLIAVDHKINGRARGHPYDYGYVNRHFIDAFKDTIPGTNERYMDRIELWLWGHAHWFVPFAPNLDIPIDTGIDLPVLKRGQLLGGSAREKKYKTPSPSNPHPGVTDAVAPWVLHEGDMTGAQDRGAMVLPGAVNDDGFGGKLYNHTYGIMDLAAGQVQYFEVPSWTKDTQNPDETPLTKPLLTLPL